MLGAVMLDDHHPVFAGEAGTSRVVYVNYDEVGGVPCILKEPELVPLVRAGMVCY
jgi:hypothetical protein